MHVEAAERCVRPSACFPLPIGVDHSRNAELVFLFVPTKRHCYVGRMFVIDPSGFEVERSRQLVARKNDAGKIRLLQKFDQTTRHRRVVSDHIEENRAAVSIQHDLARLRFVRKLRHDVEAGVFQNFSQVDCALDRGEAMI